MRQVKEIMQSRVATVDLYDRLSVAKEIFDQAPFHHLPVLEENELVGVISKHDVYRALSPHLDSLSESMKDLNTLKKRVHQIMNKRPISIDECALINHASKTMLLHNIGCLPVTEKGKLSGIITWKDLLSFYSRGRS
ncbi:CBS domain-containing protein [Shewanella sp. 202IG2-18]|uniref:CBS domain-containing protein n=1 Tax=Parashewanella hymeniacidonis TaxID=2807618 RepID=UPI00195F6CCA|nr:CBS domain-containing protein [Parashewanella hymeniacidonis]MBM7071686.1 CBS domain-containing protein [Parashewanella hymeniacidonis]